MRDNYMNDQSDEVSKHIREKIPENQITQDLIASKTRRSTSLL